MLHCRKDYNERVQDSAKIIPEDEPVFLLRASDNTSSYLVRQWAVQYLMDNGNSVDAKLVYEAVCRHADKMLTWEDSKKPTCPVMLLPKK